MWGPLEIESMLCASVAALGSPPMLTHWRIPLTHGLMPRLSSSRFSFLFSGSPLGLWPLLCVPVTCSTQLTFPLIPAPNSCSLTHPQLLPQRCGRFSSCRQAPATLPFTVACAVPLSQSLSVTWKERPFQGVGHTILTYALNKAGMDCILGGV